MRGRTVADRRDVEKLTAGWDHTMVWTCLQGHMGQILTLEDRPDSALLSVGDFCFLAGEPCRELLERAEVPLLVPQTEGWCRLIESVLGERAAPFTRYATRLRPEVGRGELGRLAAALPQGCRLAPIDEELYPRLMAARWSRDLCANFLDGADFARRGIGWAVLEAGEPVSGASSYTIYDGGIEIEIDTQPDARGRGLAAACGARLILDCLDRGLCPGWDAHDLRSLHLAEKLGYRLDRPYRAYWAEENVRR